MNVRTKKQIEANPMKANAPKTSELNPPNNITPSVATTLSGLLILLPLGVFLIGMYSGAFGQ
jgi:hypothetical protein